MAMKLPIKYAAKVLKDEFDITDDNIVRYLASKIRSLVAKVGGRVGNCDRCGQRMVLTKGGRKRFCSKECRQTDYAEFRQAAFDAFRKSDEYKKFMSERKKSANKKPKAAE